MGDPAGVGPEVILKAAAALSTRRAAPSIVVCRFAVQLQTTEPLYFARGDVNLPKRHQCALENLPRR